MSDMTVEELANVLEPLIRRVVREELAQFVVNAPETFYLKPGSPLLNDLEEILLRKQSEHIRLYAAEEVWGE
jgi:hypothetical protein